jgi:hypothetical protein
MGKIGKTPKKVNLKPDLQCKIPENRPILIYPWEVKGWWILIIFSCNFS